MKDNEEREQEMEEAQPGQEEIAELPEEEISRLKAELEAKAKEAGENYDRFLRACADLENYKKRAEKEKAEFLSYANDSLITEILPAIDNFERALSHANSDKNIESLRQGVKLTIDQLYSVLTKFGLQEIKSVGERFDPAVHHAITHEESMDAHPETVVREFQKGYTLKGRLLRPSMVAVSKKPQTH